MLLPLAFAASITLLSLMVAMWTTRIRPPSEDWDSVTELLWWIVVVTWTYATFGAAWGHEWLLGIPSALTLMIGCAIALGGAVLLVAGAAGLGRPPRAELVVTAAYARLRHPQLVGCLLLLLGIALAGRSGLGLLLAGAWLAVLALYVGREDRLLAQRFGEVHAAYRAATPAVGARRDAPDPARPQPDPAVVRRRLNRVRAVALADALLLAPLALAAIVEAEGLVGLLGPLHGSSSSPPSALRAH